jgi:hypothetical protein
MSTTLTRSYDNYSDAKTVVSDLKTAGFTDGDISIVANKESDSVMDGVATGAGVGAAAGGTVGLLTGLGLMAIPGVGPVVAAGWRAATAVGAIAGAAAGGAAGGIIDAMVDSGVSKEDAHVYAETVRRGGTLVSVRTTDDTRAKAAAILDRYKPVDIAARRSMYESEGWKSFDAKADGYDRASVERERARYL